MDAAIQLLVEKDITKITTREVVKKADVNISMLHYYYKTKNELFLAAIRESVQDIFSNWAKENINFENPKRDDLEEYFNYIIEGVFRFPNISKSIIYLSIQEECTNELSFNMPDDLEGILSKLLNESKEYIHEGIHILSHLLISLRVSTSLIETQLSLNFLEADDRKTYAKIILNRVFPELYL